MANTAGAHADAADARAIAMMLRRNTGNDGSDDEEEELQGGALEAPPSRLRRYIAAGTGWLWPAMSAIGAYLSVPLACGVDHTSPELRGNSQWCRL